MKLDTLQNYLTDPEQAHEWFGALGIARQGAGRRNLVAMAEAGVPLDLLAEVCRQFAAAAPRLADPDMAWNNLERFISAARNPLSTTALFERDPEALPNLLQLFSTSQYLSDVLVRDEESYDLLRMTEGRPVARDLLMEELRADLLTLTDAEDAMAALRQHKQRETLRIGYGDIIRNQEVSTVARQVSFLADALVESAIAFARKRLEEKLGAPRSRDGARALYCALALGKLGGIELNYSSDIDLIFLYDHAEAVDYSDGDKPLAAPQYFMRLIQRLIAAMSAPTAEGVIYELDFRLRPSGNAGPLATHFDSFLKYQQNEAWTWEHQAL
ncbi:MAG: hypothetical protein KDA37_03795, partial [Planctomycetales bacterium]|nr:hypothetical protein [Planctomycetales bacterium]